MGWMVWDGWYGMVWDGWYGMDGMGGMGGNIKIKLRF